RNTSSPPNLDGMPSRKRASTEAGVVAATVGGGLLERGAEGDPEPPADHQPVLSPIAVSATTTPTTRAASPIGRLVGRPRDGTGAVRPSRPVATSRSARRSSRAK